MTELDEITSSFCGDSFVERDKTPCISACIDFEILRCTFVPNIEVRVVNRKSFSFYHFPTTMASLCHITPEVKPDRQPESPEFTFPIISRLHDMLSG